MASRAKRSRRGFTLVEALAAGAILALAGAALGTAVSHAMRSLTLARDYQRAAELLDRTLTKIDFFGPARLLEEGPGEGVFQPPHERFAWRVGIVPRMTGHLHEVTVQIIWAVPGGGQRSVEAQTLINDARESWPEGPAWEDL